MSGLIGAFRGLGKGMSREADRNLKKWDKEELLAEQEKLIIAREKRVDAAARLRQTDQNIYTEKNSQLARKQKVDDDVTAQKDRIKLQKIKNSGLIEVQKAKNNSGRPATVTFHKVIGADGFERTFAKLPDGTFIPFEEWNEARIRDRAAILNASHGGPNGQNGNGKNGNGKNGNGTPGADAVNETAAKVNAATTKALQQYPGKGGSRPDDPILKQAVDSVAENVGIIYGKSDNLGKLTVESLANAAGSTAGAIRKGYGDLWNDISNSFSGAEPGGLIYRTPITKDEFSSLSKKDQKTYLEGYPSLASKIKAIKALETTK